MQDNTNINIWQQAIKQKSSQINISNQQKTLIFIGNQSSGKSSLIKLLKTDHSHQTKPTILFEYSYIKKQSINKQTIHCYQLSNKSQQQLIPSLITKQSYPKTKIILCIDLSRPQSILSQLQQWLDIIRKQVQNCNREKININQKIKQYQQDITKIMQQHQDINIIKPLPIETIIIACKYDQLQKTDSENRKWIAKTLRYYANIYHTHLFYSANNNATIISQIRNIFNQVLFSSRRTVYSQRDHLKPIFISRGQDSISQLSIPVSNSISTIDILKKQLIAIYGIQQDNNKKQTAQVDLLKYQQNKIDQLIEKNKKQMGKINAKINYNTKAK